MPYLAKTYRMGEEAHMAQLESSAVCGHKVQKEQAGPYSPYLCSEYKRYLEVGFGLDVSQDSPQVHPPMFCKPCFLTARRAVLAKEGGGGYRQIVSPFPWTHHTDDTCQGHLVMKKNM